MLFLAYSWPGTAAALITLDVKTKLFSSTNIFTERKSFTFLFNFMVYTSVDMDCE